MDTYDHSGRAVGLGEAQCAREALAGDASARRPGPPIPTTPPPAQAPLVVRSLLTAGVDTTVHGLSTVLYGFATHPRAVAAATRSAGAWPGSPSRRRCAGSPGADAPPDRDKRTSRSRAFRARRPQHPDIPRRGQPRPAPLGEPGRLRPLPRSLRARRFHQTPQLHAARLGEHLRLGALSLSPRGRRAGADLPRAVTTPRRSLPPALGSSEGSPPYDDQPLLTRKHNAGANPPSRTRPCVHVSA